MMTGSGVEGSGETSANTIKSSSSKIIELLDILCGFSD